MNTTWMRWLFMVAGVYDAGLAVAFLSFGPRIFGAFGVTPPNHWGYLQFPALLLVVFAVMFFRIAADPIRRRELMLYGAGLKAAYCLTTFGHELSGGIPGMWMPWAWLDLLFLASFLLAWSRTGRAAPA